MTTREIYFKTVVLCDLPAGLFWYIYKVDDAYQFGNITLELSTNKETANKSIERMVEIEKMDGFTYWSNSPEGEAFIKSIKIKL